MVWQWRDGERGRLSLQGQRLEVATWGPPPEQAPTLVMLHEGLGCVALWRDFPTQLAARTGLGVLAYSRAGYGQSSDIPLPRPLDYLQREAREHLLRVLDACGVGDTYLLGHSDGGSIAALYAGEQEDPRIRGLCLLAPHFFVEEKALVGIRRAREAYQSGVLKARLARYHQHVDSAFYGWAEAWLNPKFLRWNIEAVISGIQAPTLGIQGREDEYGTLAQLDALALRLGADTYQSLVPAPCGHSPHLEQMPQCIDAIDTHVRRCLA